MENNKPKNTNAPGNATNTLGNATNAPGNATNAQGNAINAQGNVTNTTNTSGNNTLTSNSLNSSLNNSLNSSLSTTNVSNSSRPESNLSSINNTTSINNTNLLNNTSKNNTSTNNKKNNTKNNTKNNKSTFNSVKETVASTVNTVKERIREVRQEEDSSTIMNILKIALVFLIFVALFYVARYLFMSYQETLYNSPYLLEGIKNGKNALVISQNPENPSHIPIIRSENKEGIQFTYDFWLMIENFGYKSGEWKHIFHKGNAESYPNRAPGVWLHPNTNAIRVYMNTQTNILEYVDIENIPGRKWLHMSIVLDDKDLDIYVNGYLKVRKVLSSVPKQNNGDFWVNMFGGFEGNIARIRYYSRAITTDEILSNVRKGPGDTACIDTGELPSYLDDDWWN